MKDVSQLAPPPGLGGISTLTLTHRWSSQEWVYPIGVARIVLIALIPLVLIILSLQAGSTSALPRIADSAAQCSPMLGDRSRGFY